jgi:hypothetical protein
MDKSHDEKYAFPGKFSLERLTAIFLSKDLEPVNARLDYYVEQDGCLILKVSESRIMGAMSMGVDMQEDGLSAVWKNSKEYDLVAILKSSANNLTISFANPFKDAAVFVMHANIVSMETDTDFSDRHVTKNKTMKIEYGKRWEADSKDAKEFLVQIKQIRREIKLRDVGI